jgi:hypothetical protein
VATLAEIQSAYFAINRTSLDDAGAISVLTKINAGDFTLFDYIGDLSAKAASTTGAAVSLLAFVMGSTPSSEHLDELKVAADAQQASYAGMGVANPAMGAFEAFGKSLAGDPNSGFAAKYGALSGADFIAETYKSVYGQAPAPDALANLENQIAYFVDLYTKAGFDPAQAALEAKGAVLGQIIAYAFVDPVAAEKSTLDDQVTTFLAKAASGDATVYDAPLPAPGETPPGGGPTPPTHTTAPIDFTPNVGTTQGSSDASTAIALGGNTMLVGDDEANVLRVYSRDGGVALKEISYDSFVNLGDEADLEASARIGNTLYFTGSHSNSKSGADENSREVIFSATVSGEGANTTLFFTGKYLGMEAVLAAWDHTGASGKAADYYGITPNAAAGIPERDAGVSIEGMTFSPDNGAMWLAFRAPVTGGADLHKALIVPVLNYDAVLTASAAPILGTAIELDLGGRGIRSIDKNAAGQYIVLAGPAGGASADVANDFRLYTWDGQTDGNGQAIHLVERAADLDALRDGTGGSFESLVEVPDNLTDGTWVQLLQDNGDTVWPGESQVSKDLPEGDQHFNGNWIQLGAAVAADTTAPLMMRSTPGDNATGVAGSAKVELPFNEAVHAGTGNLVLKSGATTIATFAANDSRITYAYNKITIDTSALLGSDKDYSLEIAAGAIVDAKGNAFAGLDTAHAIDFHTASAATTLVAGDIAFVGYNTDGGTDAFAFVLLKDINAGTSVRFTDKEWTGTAFNTGESDLLWTASSNLSAGTIVTIQPDSGTPLASSGALTGSGGGLSKSGEQLFAFTGTVAAPGTFLAAIGMGSGNGGLVTAGADLSATSFVPAGLSLGVNAVNFAQINAKYTGVLTGTADELRAAIADASHWSSVGDSTPSAIAGNQLQLGYSSVTVNGPTTLAAGEVVFLGINTDSTDAFAFMVTRAINAGTQIGFTDRDYVTATGIPSSGESAYIWTADQNYSAGTVFTIQPDTGTNNPIASQGTAQGKGGGLSGSGETLYAFQGSIAGLGNGVAGAITASAWLGGINAGGAAAGDAPAGVTLQSFALDNAAYAGSRNAVDITAFKTLALDPVNWTLSDTVPTALNGNDFFI